MYAHTRTEVHAMLIKTGMQMTGQSVNDIQYGNQQFTALPW